jgi:hypothetical protein
VLEFHVRKLRGDGDRLVHEAERRREDDGAAGPRQPFDGTLGVRSFRDVLEERSLDLVAELLIHLLAADVMRLRPAAVGLGTHVKETCLDLVLGDSRHGSRGNDGRGKSKDQLFHIDSVLSGLFLM